MPTPSQWIEAARPRTLPAALAPVAIGTGAAAALREASLAAALLALLVALCLQVGVNLANDYSDGIRGTDEPGRRVGPIRLVGQAYAPPGTVKAAAIGAFGVAALFGLALLALANTFWLLLLGAAAILAAWYYTGGSHPYGYLGLGEAFVFVFFGLAATLGTMYTQALRLSPAAWAGAVGVGALSCAILMANNIRDIDSDTVADKRTLAVRLGDARARTAYLLLVGVAAAAVPVAAVFHTGALLALLAFALAVGPARLLAGGATGHDLVAVLAGTGRLTLAYGVLLGLGMALVPTTLLL